MTVEANKAAALAIVMGVGRGEIDRAAFTDDAAWWMQGRGELAIDAFAEMQRQVAATLLDGPGRMEIHGVTAEDDRVAVEAEIHQPLRKGGTYTGSYHFLLRFRDGKAWLVKEYFDTARARDAFRGGGDDRA